MMMVLIHLHHRNTISTNHVTSHIKFTSADGDEDRRRRSAGGLRS